MRITF